MQRRGAFEHIGQRGPGPRQPAHDGADRRAHDFGGFLVRIAFQRHQGDRHALLVRQIVERAAHLFEGKLRQGRSLSVDGIRLGRFVDRRRMTHLARPDLVNPNVLAHAKTPFRQVGVRRDASGQQALNRRLQQIVRVMVAARQRQAKAFQPGQQIQKRRPVHAFVNGHTTS